MVSETLRSIKRNVRNLVVNIIYHSGIYILHSLYKRNVRLILYREVSTHLTEKKFGYYVYDLNFIKIKSTTQRNVAHVDYCVTRDTMLIKLKETDNKSLQRTHKRRIARSTFKRKVEIKTHIREYNKMAHAPLKKNVYSLMVKQSFPTLQGLRKL